MEQKKQVHIFISGFVQGVGFRKFIRGKAKKLLVTGWIRNLPDGRVEALVQGTSRQLNQLLFFCNRGPYFSQVDQVVVEWEDVSEYFSDFSILK